MSLLSGTRRWLQIARSMGPRWVSFRVAYAVRLRSGALRRATPATKWDDRPLVEWLTDPSLTDAAVYFGYRRCQSTRFFFDARDRKGIQSLFDQWDTQTKNPIHDAEEFACGRLHYFERVLVDVGQPPHWHQNPVTGQTTPNSMHWSQIGDFQQGDINNRSD